MMDQASFLSVIILGFGATVLSLFGIAFFYKYSESLPARKKGKFNTISMSVGATFMLTLSNTVFKESTIGEVMQASLVGFGLFGSISLLLWAFSPKNTQSNSHE